MLCVNTVKTIHVDHGFTGKETHDLMFYSPIMLWTLAITDQRQVGFRRQGPSTSIWLSFSNRGDSMLQTECEASSRRAWRRSSFVFKKSVQKEIQVWDGKRYRHAQRLTTSTTK